MSSLWGQPYTSSGILAIDNGKVHAQLAFELRQEFLQRLPARTSYQVTDSEYAQRHFDLVRLAPSIDLSISGVSGHG
jgi:hypothetical protein